MPTGAHLTFASDNCAAPPHATLTPLSLVAPPDKQRHPKRNKTVVYWIYGTRTTICKIVIDWTDDDVVAYDVIKKNYYAMNAMRTENFLLHLFLTSTLILGAHKMQGKVAH